MKRALRIILIVMICTPIVAHATQTIYWKDLVPAPSEQVNLPPLNEKQVSLMYEILAYQYAEKRREMSEKEMQQYHRNVDAFAKTGADLVQLLKLRKRAVEVEKARYLTLDESMSFDQVSIAGFMVPIQMHGLKTTQFLLVPTAGACVHTPPPPISQIILVDYTPGHDVIDLYQPIVVQGDINVKVQSLNIDFIDGNQDVNAGYVMSALTIKRYK